MNLRQLLETPPSTHGKVIAVGQETGLLTPLALEVAAHLGKRHAPEGRSVTYIEATFDRHQLPTHITKQDTTLEHLHTKNTPSEILAAIRGWEAEKIGTLLDTHRRTPIGHPDPAATLHVLQVLRTQHDWTVIRVPDSHHHPEYTNQIAAAADMLVWQANGWRREGSLQKLDQVEKPPEQTLLVALDEAGDAAATEAGYRSRRVPAHLTRPGNLVELRGRSQENRTWLEELAQELTGEKAPPERSEVGRQEQRRPRRHEKLIQACRSHVAYSWDEEAEEALTSWAHRELGETTDTLGLLLGESWWNVKHLPEAAALTRALTR